MTTVQLATVAFGGSREVAKHRLVILHRLGVVRRFRPFRCHGDGSAPYHYMLGPAGAAVLASVRATTVRDMGYDPGDMQALAHSPRLAHIVGVNDVLASLTAAARHRGASLAAWWSERRCTAHWGDVVAPTPADAGARAASTATSSSSTTGEPSRPNAWRPRWPTMPDSHR